MAVDKHFIVKEANTTFKCGVYSIDESFAVPSVSSSSEIGESRQNILNVFSWSLEKSFMRVLLPHE